MKKKGLIIFLIACNSIVFSQTTKELPSITFRGKLTFERKMNVHKQMDEMMKGNANSSMADNFKKQIPKYKVDIFEMIFTDKQSIYKPAPDGISESKMMMGNIPADRNIVFNDYETMKSVAEKKVYEKVYLVSDSIKQYQWKITEEYRNIVGFNCRRAETIIMDSVYVIAFYTDGILAEGGPEGFNGLPGMILGVVIPRLNTTYFATKLDNYVANEKEIIPPTKGDKTSYKSLEDKMRDSMKQWGDYLQRILWYVSI
jgi:GLPGLI family protein